MKDATIDVATLPVLADIDDVVREALLDLAREGLPAEVRAAVKRAGGLLNSPVAA